MASCAEVLSRCWLVRTVLEQCRRLQAQAAMDEVLDLSALTDLAVNSSTADVLAALKLLDGINRCATNKRAA
jgi:hypothetical protein